MGEPSSNGVQREVAVRGVEEVVRGEGVFDGVGTGFHGWEVGAGDDMWVTGVCQQMGGSKGWIAQEHIKGVDGTHVAILAFMVGLVIVVGEGGEGRGRDACKEATVQRGWEGRSVSGGRCGGGVSRREEGRGCVVIAVIAV